MCISELITAVKDVLVGFAAIATVIIGSKGLQTEGGVPGTVY